MVSYNQGLAGKLVSAGYDLCWIYLEVSWNWCTFKSSILDWDLQTKKTIQLLGIGETLTCIWQIKWLGARHTYCTIPYHPRSLEQQWAVTTGLSTHREPSKGRQRLFKMVSINLDSSKKNKPTTYSLHDPHLHSFTLTLWWGRYNMLQLIQLFWHDMSIYEHCFSLTTQQKCGK